MQRRRRHVNTSSAMNRLNLAILPTILATLMSFFVGCPQPVVANSEKRQGIEPSGAIYLQDLKKFLIISDETEKMKRVSLFLVGKDGRAEPSPILIDGLEKIADVESISQDTNFIYLMSSQSLTKKGDDKKRRNLFVRLERQGLSIKLIDQIELRPLLLKALLDSEDELLHGLGELAEDKDIEIESHFVDGNDLYFALKQPLFEKNIAPVLVIHNFKTLFRNSDLSARQIELWKTLDFSDDPASVHRVADMIKVNGSIFLTTCRKNTAGGSVWRFAGAGVNMKPIMIKNFPELRPEGLAYDSDDDSLFVAFDEKKHTAPFVRIRFKK